MSGDVIYKYKVMPLHIAEGIELPKKGKALSAICQGMQDIFVYFEHDPDDFDLEMRYFYFVGTGQTLPSGKKKYIAKVEDARGFVWHVYEALYG